jgi:hypothetical protein
MAAVSATRHASVLPGTLRFSSVPKKIRGTIRARSLHRSFAKRFLLSGQDEVIFAGVARKDQAFIAVTEMGHFCSRAIEQLYVYNGTGCGEIIFSDSTGAVISATISSTGGNFTVSLTLNNGRSERVSLSDLATTQAPTRFLKLGEGERVVSAKFQDDDSHAGDLSQMGRDHQWPNTKLQSQKA